MARIPSKKKDNNNLDTVSWRPTKPNAFYRRSTQGFCVACVQICRLFNSNHLLYGSSNYSIDLNIIHVHIWEVYIFNKLIFLFIYTPTYLHTMTLIKYTIHNLLSMAQIFLSLKKDLINSALDFFIFNII